MLHRRGAKHAQLFVRGFRKGTVRSGVKQSSRKAFWNMEPGVPSILDSIGNTPLVRLSNKTSSGHGASIWAKLELMNPGGSVKDRIASILVDDAIQRGLLKRNGAIVEATSGNMGISLAMVCAARGIRLFLMVTEGMNVERKLNLTLRGAEVIQVPQENGPGMLGSTILAKEFALKHNFWFVNQFENPMNVIAHELSTGPEIAASFEESHSRVDALVCGIGTGGTITGVGHVLKEKFENCRVIGVEPRDSAVVSGNSPGSHGIQGIGAGFIPAILDLDILSGIEVVGDDEACKMCEHLTVKEGIFCGMSGGACVAAAVRVASKMAPDENVVAVIPDSGERYFSSFTSLTAAESFLGRGTPIGIEMKRESMTTMETQIKEEPFN